jgi:hypothetical protein
MAAALVGGLVQFVTKLCLVWKDFDISQFEDITISFVRHALLISLENNTDNYCPQKEVR